MSSSLESVWEAATPFEPVIGKDRHLVLALTLLIIGLILSGVFALNRSLVNVAALGLPASIAFGFGAVYMICAVGVYV